MSELTIVLLEYGSILVFGFIGAWFLRKIHIPQVLGFILSGMIMIIINDFAFPFLNNFSIDVRALLRPLTTLALGIIGFNIGAELKIDELKKVNKKLFFILIADSIGTFVIVSLLVFLFTNFSLNFSLILGALASATAPAATADVLWEYKSRGPLTQAVLFILVVDDIISIFLVQITTKVTKNQITGGNLTALNILGEFFLEIGLAILIGLVAGVILTLIINKVKDYGQILELLIGVLILIMGLALFFKASAILTTMIYGMIIASFVKSDTGEIFHDVFKIGSPIVAMFFIIVGINMNILDFKLIGIIGLVYLVGRTMGKVGAVSLTARVVKAPKEIQRYLGFCLFSQAGVALGLAAHIDAEFQGTIKATEAGLVLTTITGTILVVQIIGPLLVKWSIHRAGEVGGKLEQQIVAAALLREKKEKEIQEKNYAKEDKILIAEVQKD
ncbi:MAG: cation:proton antiporter [Candidatus Heimdallarchaeaceae archaeon]